MGEADVGDFVGEREPGGVGEVGGEGFGEDGGFGAADGGGGAEVGAVGEVGRLDEVVIDEEDGPYAEEAEQTGGLGTEGAAANDGDDESTDMLACEGGLLEAAIVR